jgi:microcystin-dependent protein
MKTKLILAVAMVWAGAVLAQLPAKDGVLLEGDFVRNIGLLDLTDWGVGGNYGNQHIRGLSISVGQMCGVNPDTGATITDTNNLISAVTRTLNVKHNAEFVNGNVGIGTPPSGTSTEKLKVAGSIQSTLGGSTGGYMFSDTTARRESRLETAYALVPIGGVVAFFKFTGWFLPSNFKECNGTVVSDVDSPMNGQTVPNLNGQAATIEGSAGGAGGFVGANTINLTEAQMPTHNHGASSSTAGNHSHTDSSMSNPGDHSHGYILGNTTEDMDNSWSASQRDVRIDYGWVSTGGGGSHTHSFTTTTDGNHTHPITVNNTGSGSDVDNRQRSCQLTWIIRIK